MERFKQIFCSKSIPAWFCGAAFLSFTAALFAFPIQVRDATLSSILYCLNVLVPSLFPFMALTSFAVRSQAGEAIKLLFGQVVRRIFRLPGICAAPLFMSFLGGYPAGARGVSLLLKQGNITREQAGRMMLFCVNPGVAFVVTFAGGTMLGSFHTGWLLFAAVTLSGILLGLLTGFRSPLPQDPPVQEKRGYQGAIARSAADACSGTLKMSACVVLFSGFTAILHGSGLYQFLVRAVSHFSTLAPAEAAALLSFLIEVTGGVGDAARFRVSGAFYAFGLAFAGACVHLQVFSFFAEFPVSKVKFLLFRLLHGVLAWGAYSLLSRLFPGSQEAAFFTPGNIVSGGWRAGAAGGFSLLLLCAAFLLIFSQGSNCEREDSVVK